MLLLLDAARPQSRGPHFAALAFASVVASGLMAWSQWGLPATSALSNMIVIDRFGVAVRLIVLFAAGLAILSAPSYLAPRGMDRGEFYALLLLSTSGMTLLSVSSDLIMVFLSIELLSLALYVLAGFDRERSSSVEAAMKYFLLGAFASAFLLYGIAYVYGAAGTTNLLKLDSVVNSASVDSFRLLAVAVGLLTVGLGFKVSMVPFHMWTPDVYEGSPTPVTAFMAAGTKAAAFAAIVRTLSVAMNGLRWDWRPVFIALALVTIIFASILAVAQTDLKRMLAYSSVAHAGFISLGVIAATRTGAAAVVYYLFVYSAMTIGAFGCIMLFREGIAERTHLAQFSGLGQRHPGAAALFAFFLFALAGIPPTGGFFAKFYVFFSVIREGYPWLAAIAVVGSVIAAFFYLRVAVVMFMQDPIEVPDAEPSELTRSIGLRVALGICALVVIATGVFPGFFLNLTGKAATFAKIAPAAASTQAPAEQDPSQQDPSQQAPSEQAPSEQSGQ